MGNYIFEYVNNKMYYFNVFFFILCFSREGAVNFIILSYFKSGFSLKIVRFRKM